MVSFMKKKQTWRSWLNYVVIPSPLALMTEIIQVKPGSYSTILAFGPSEHAKPNAVFCAKTVYFGCVQITNF